jgi:hypothetical protein
VLSFCTVIILLSLIGISDVKGIGVRQNDGTALIYPRPLRPSRPRSSPRQTPRLPRRPPPEGAVGLPLQKQSHRTCQKSGAAWLHGDANAAAVRQNPTIAAASSSPAPRARAFRSRSARRCAFLSRSARCATRLGFGRIAASEIEVSNMLVNLG